MSGVSRHLIGSMAQHLQSWFTTNNIEHVAWENRPLDPPSPNDTEKPWSRVTFFPAETRQASVGDEGLNEMGGIMLVNVFYPKGKSSGTPNQLADSLMSHFKRGTTTTAVSGYQARVFNTWRDAALPDDTWFNVPVRVRFFQHVTNT